MSYEGAHIHKEERIQVSRNRKKLSFDKQTRRNRSTSIMPEKFTSLGAKSCAQRTPWGGTFSGTVHKIPKARRQPISGRRPRGKIGEKDNQTKKIKRKMVKKGAGRSKSRKARHTCKIYLSRGKERE